MSGRWSVDQVLALTADPASAAAARGLAHPEPWSATGTRGPLVWGLCRGSGPRPYQTIAELTGPAYTCTCPSRKFPCKHALGLLLLWSAGGVEDATEPPDYVTAWQESRANRRVATPRGPRDEQAAAKRAEQRTARVAAGLDELETWLRDQVRSGLSGVSGSYRHAEPVAARMVDAQAPGVAARLRRLSAVPVSGDGWPERLLAGYGQLHLLARAHAQLDTLPPALAATVRSHVGYQVSRESVLADEAVRDEWLVLAVRELLDGAIPTRRSYLRGRRTGRYALLLAFDPQGTFAADAHLQPGRLISADLHFYPGRPPLRATIGAQHGEPVSGGAPEVHLDLDEQLREWGRVLELDPWSADWPAVLRGVPIPGDAVWHLAEAEGTGIPLLTGGIDPWVLAAVGGGEPVVVAGEWSADGFRPLTVWHGDDAVAL